MLNRFIKYLATKRLILNDKPTLVAISGGVDSIVLADLFNQANLKFIIVHCHFGLRHPEAQEDKIFVGQLAKRYGVPLYTKDFATKNIAKKHKISIQLAARKLRYAWFEQLLLEHNLDKIATAHHLDDELETLLYNLTKGTGIAGLHGILPQQGAIIRPLGFATKKEILQYAQEQCLEWREDTSNCSLVYQRNRIRHKVVPELKRINPSLEKTFSFTLTKLRQVEQVFRHYSEKLKKEAISYQEPYYYLNIAKLDAAECPSVVIFEWLRAYNFTFPCIDKWWKCRPQSGKRIYTATHWLLSDRKYWILGMRKKEEKKNATLTTETALVNVGGYSFTIDHFRKDADYILPTSCNVAALDRDKLSFPLAIRPWQQGDIFFPLGMKHRKKVSNFLIDAKVSLHHKEKVYVLTSAGKIAWIIGYRIDDRFKLTKITKKIYQISVSKDL